MHKNITTIIAESAGRVNAIDEVINNRIELYSINSFDTFKYTLGNIHVYALFDTNKRLFYIGRSETSIQNRITTHRNSKKYKVGYVAFFACKTIIESKAIEKTLIERHPETINKFHNPKWLWSNYCWTLRPDFLVLDRSK